MDTTRKHRYYTRYSIRQRKNDTTAPQKRKTRRYNTKIYKPYTKSQQLKTKELNNDFLFYKNSLREAEMDIQTQQDTGKALKDIVGEAFERHRARVWTHFGFNVSKHRYGAMFDVDWSITWKDKLIALEEDKGHYVDSCFLERAISGFCKTVNTYQKKEKEVPLLILHSFTKYNKFNDKLEEDLDTRKTEIKDEIQRKLVYTTLVESNRLPRRKWFSKDYYRGYTDNVDNKLIIKDIEFIRSLIPISE